MREARDDTVGGGLTLTACLIRPGSARATPLRLPAPLARVRETVGGTEPSGSPFGLVTSPWYLAR